ncbi:Uncharacterised protein [Mycobacteroides abscessus subsp. massiliense]|nr:Uncharacterised protein [Mycobacteroides abscessus subsp. massiliense]
MTLYRLKRQFIIVNLRVQQGLVKVLLYHMLKLQQLKHLQLHSVNLKKVWIIRV